MLKPYTNALVQGLLLLVILVALVRIELNVVESQLGLDLVFKP